MTFLSPPHPMYGTCLWGHIRITSFSVFTTLRNSFYSAWHMRLSDGGMVMASLFVNLLCRVSDGAPFMGNKKITINTISFVNSRIRMYIPRIQLNHTHISTHPPVGAARLCANNNTGINQQIASFSRKLIFNHKDGKTKKQQWAKQQQWATIQDNSSFRR